MTDVQKLVFDRTTTAADAIAENAGIAQGTEQYRDVFDQIDQIDKVIDAAGKYKITPDVPPETQHADTINLLNGIPGTQY
jgi:hypothetical protein